MSEYESVILILEDNVVTEPLVLSDSDYRILTFPLRSRHGEGFSLFASDIMPVDVSTFERDMRVLILSDSTVIESENFEDIQIP